MFAVQNPNFAIPRRSRTCEMIFSSSNPLELVNAEDEEEDGAGGEAAAEMDNRLSARQTIRPRPLFRLPAFGWSPRTGSWELGRNFYANHRRL